MTEQQEQLFFDLLTKKAVYGLDDIEEQQLRQLDTGVAERELQSLEITAAAIGVAQIPGVETMPSHLRARILADSHDHISVPDVLPAPRGPEPERRTDGSWFGWLGWVAAAAAFGALAITQFVIPRAVDKGPTASVRPTETPQSVSVAEQRAHLLATATDVVKAAWSAGNVETSKGITGEVVWSDQQQTGYATFRGLPVNDAYKTCYQLWIFDQTQDKATPIDGGIFDVNADGEVIVPIKAKLQAFKPEMFALTIERHGGVVVSKRDKVAALAKVEPHTS